MAAAKARKQRMLDMDKERAKKVPPNDHEKFNQNKNDTLLTKA
jgi:hypothetical protein